MTGGKDMTNSNFYRDRRKVKNEYPDRKFPDYIDIPPEPTEEPGQRIFPIQNDAACALKWSWMTLYLSMDMFNMCHRTGGFHFSREPDSEFRNFNSHPKLVEERTRMANNQWPKESCRYCKRVEDAGGTSERQIFSKKTYWNPHQIQWSEDGKLRNEVTPSVMEVYFKNTCNLACTYCSPMFSSKIEADIRKNGPASKHYNLDGSYSVSPMYEKRKKQFWEWMREHSCYLKHFHILGGEPLYQKEEFEETLTFFEDESLLNDKLGIKMFSNLMLKPNLFKQKIGRIQKMLEKNLIRQWIIVCSIDAWGPEQEYARYGIDLKQWTENFETLMETDIIVNVHSTITPLTTPTNWVLRKKVVEYEKKYGKEIHQSWNIIQNPPFLDPTKYGSFVLEDLEKLISLIPHNKEEHKLLNGYKKAIENKPEPDIEMLKEFVRFSDEMDRRRKQDWRSIYPKLNSFLEETLGEKV